MTEREQENGAQGCFVECAAPDAVVLRLAPAVLELLAAPEVHAHAQASLRRSALLALTQASIRPWLRERAARCLANLLQTCQVVGPRGMVSPDASPIIPEADPIGPSQVGDHTGGSCFHVFSQMEGFKVWQAHIEVRVCSGTKGAAARSAGRRGPRAAPGLGACLERIHSRDRRGPAVPRACRRRACAAGQH